MNLSHDVASPSHPHAGSRTQCGIPDYHEDELTSMTDDVAMRSVSSLQSHAHNDLTSLPSSASASSRPHDRASLSSKSVQAPHNQAHHMQERRQHRESSDEGKRFVSEMCGDARKGAKDFQEDSHFMFVSPDGSVMAAGMFDGHGGKNGVVASQCAKEVAIEFFQKTWRACLEWSEGRWKEEFEKLFKEIHTKIRKEFVDSLKKAKGVAEIDPPNSGIIRTMTIDHRIIPVHGGTTGTVVAVIFKPDGGRYCVTANVGDSDALLCPSRTTGTPEFAADHLSVDHGPDSAIEFDRIQRLDKRQFPHKLLFVYDKPGVYYKYNCPPVFRADGVKEPKYAENPWGNGLRPTNVRYDPAVYAVSPKGAIDQTCIAMTRSMGDFYAHQYGLSCIPDVSVRSLKPDCDYTIAVGSDGVWDCWRWEDFSDFLHEGNSPQQAPQSEAQAHAQHLHTPSSQSHQSNTAPHLPIKPLTVQLLLESVKRAIANFGILAYDDASIVLMRVGPNRPVVASTKEGTSTTTDADYSPEPSPRAFVTDAAPVYRSGSSQHTNGRAH